VIARGYRGGPLGGGNPTLIFFVILLLFNFRSLGALFQQAIDDPLSFWAFIVAIVMGITFHEFMHAYVAHRLGDDTARLMGRMSLNPLVHFDLLGSLFLLLLRFGYGKPVPVNDARLRGALGVSAVSLAGPLTNLALASLCAVPLHFSGSDVFGGAYFKVLQLIVVYNCLLFVFNLLPIPPLDGSRVIYGLLPPRQQYSWRSYEQYGPILLLAVVFFLPYLGYNLLGPLVTSPALKLAGLLLGRSF
jgi:Zn-dependent protease